MRWRMNISGRSQSLAVPGVFCVLMIAGIARAGSVVNDGSLGSAAIAHSGDIFTIRAASGRQVGSNLFYSLSTLNLDQGETANFKGPASVMNVLTRVTGGTSTIDGTLECDIPNANFYLINPAGVVFGPGAALNVQGSFAVTTANEIRFADASVFGPPDPADGTLTTAAPAAFGFLSGSPAPLTMNSASLIVPSGKTLMVASGGLSMTGALLKAPAGQVAVASVGSAGVATISGSTRNAIDVSSFPSLGPIELSGGAKIKANGNAGGRIMIRGGQLIATNSNITAVTQGTGDGQGVNVRVSGDLAITTTRVDASTIASGHGGDLVLQSHTLEVTSGSIVEAATIAAGEGGDVSISVAGVATIDGTATPSVFTAIDTETGSDSLGAGSGGDLKLTAGALVVRDGVITADTAGPGNGGKINVRIAGLATINGEGNTSAGISAESADSVDSIAGAGGDVKVSAGALTVRGGASISASTTGAGAGGDVKVNVAGPLVLNGIGDSTGSTGIIADSDLAAAASAGKGGNITVTAQSLAIKAAASIDASTSGTGNGGSMVVSIAGPTLIDGTLTPELVTGLDAETDFTDPGGGEAGNIRLITGSLQMNGADIGAATFGTGDSGNVHVRVMGNAVVDGKGNHETGIFATTEDETDADPGNGGNVTVVADSLLIRAGSSVETDTLNSGAGGSLVVNVGGLLKMNGTGDPTGSTGIFSGSELVHGGGNGGPINVNAGTLTIVHESLIDSSSDGTGNGGNLNVSVKGLTTLNGTATPGQFTGLAAQTGTTGRGFQLPGGGEGGDLTLNTGALAMASATIEANTFSSGAGGAVNINVADTMLMLPSMIAASSELTIPDAGRAGDVNISVGGSLSNSGGIIAAITNGPANGGSIHVHSQSLDMTNLGTISTQSNGSGEAGGMDIDVAQDVTLNSGAQLLVSASQSNGGSISVNSGGDISISNATLSAQAAQNGGSISLQSPGTVVSFFSNLTAAAGGTGGNVTIDPALVVLDHSSVAANASRGNGGNVTITSGQFLQFDTNINVSSEFGVAGMVLVSSPDTDIAGSLIELDAALASQNVGLQSACGEMISGDESSFIQTSNGGLPAGPGGWLPIFDDRRRP